MESTSPLAEHLDAVEAALHDHVARASSSGLPLYRMVQYQLGWVDQTGEEAFHAQVERLQGTMAMEAARSVATDAAPGAVAACAAAAELFAQSIAVHEDMQTAEPRADGRSAIWWIWGPAQAINVGDGLHAMARLALFQMQAHGHGAEQTLDALSALDAGAMAYYEGQYLELTFQERIDVTEAQYLKMATGRRGALMGMATALGAHAAGGDADQVASLRSFGERLGVASQLAADVRALTGDAGQGRALSKSKLYPVVHAIANAPLAQKRELGALYFKRVMEPADLEAIRASLEGSGALDATMSKAREEAQAAREILAVSGVSDEAIARWNAVIASFLAEVDGKGKT